MALVPDQKFSTFQNGGDLAVGDIIVGLRNNLNTRFNYTGELPSGVIIAIANGGTGANNAVDARTNLGLGTMAVQNANAVAITGGTWQGGTIAFAYGGTNVTSVPTTSSASNFAAWDASQNIPANNFLPKLTSTASSGATLTLTVASTQVQEITGTLTHTVQMPVVATLTTGHPFTIINNSSGAVTVNSSGGNLILTMAANTTAYLLCVSTSGTGAASWNASYVYDAGAGVLSITGTANQIIASASTGNITLSTPQDIASTSSPTFANLTLTNPLTIANGGTAKSSFTAYAPIFGGTTGTGALQQTAALTNGQLIIGSTGGLPAAGTLTAGTGITITNGAGTITISAAAGQTDGLALNMLLMGG